MVVAGVVSVAAGVMAVAAVEFPGAVQGSRIALVAGDPPLEPSLPGVCLPYLKILNWLSLPPKGVFSSRIPPLGLEDKNQSIFRCREENKKIVLESNIKGKINF